MYWFIHQFPELNHLEPGQRAQLLARLPWWTYPLFAARAIAGGVLVGALMAAWLSVRMHPAVVAVAALVTLAVIAIGLYGLQVSRVRRVMRNTISEGFRGGRPPFCFGCGYDLRASEATLCPECGQTIHSG